MKPKRSELAASLKGSLKKIQRAIFTFSSGQMMMVLIQKGLGHFYLTWVCVCKNFGWLLFGSKIATEKQKLRYHWETESRSIFKVAPFALSHSGRFPASQNTRLGSAVPKVFRRLPVPKVQGHTRAPRSSLENIYYFLLQRVTMLTNISEVLSFFQERTWLVVLYPLRFIHWECKIKMLPASPILWGSSQ